ncbi:cytochrome P450 [Trichodelitschia bisporula]|uniref:Cytochrome P450 n=1 Tax=Trichodelitschia bisporula TaxID=703511 RepID=A0A6G1HJ87_9PEZI|nr:cytochrome P450 [Trichodelitschia bisporula]
MALLTLSWTHIGLGLAALIIATLARAVYRLTLHPLAKFPGPKLAAVSYKYEFFYDGIRPGTYNSHIALLHATYGPVVRINPSELHISDPRFIDTLYAVGGRRRDKSAYFLNAFGSIAAMSGFATPGHEHHRLRRAPLNRFFSRASIARLEPLVHELAQRLCDRLLAWEGRGSFDVAMAYSCYTTDVITAYCFGQAHGFLDREGGGWEPNLRPAIHAGCRTLPVMRQWPWIFSIINSLPDALAKAMDPDLAIWIDHLNALTAHIGTIKARFDKGGKADLPESVFVELLQSDLPDAEKTVPRLGAEASSLISAGTETTAWTLSVLTFHLLDKPAMLERLTGELDRAAPDPKRLPPWASLERLPFLSACILEALRLSYGVATRLARVAPDEDLVYEGKGVRYVIPRGTAVSMANPLIHHNEEIFPEPLEFVPERWLDGKGGRRRDLEGYLLSFSKGSRQCLGMNLAYAELYVGAAAVVLRVLPRMELVETTVRDVRYHHEVFIPAVDPESKGVRVAIKA